MKKTAFLYFFLFGLTISGMAQKNWSVSDYEKWTHDNFRENQAFNKTFNASDPDYLLLDAALFFLTNEERAKRNIEPMRYHKLIEVAAYHHSYKMATTGFFSHQNPKEASRKSPEDRGRLAGIANPAFAENIAYNYPSAGNSYLQVAEKLMNQWMNSSGHKANILSKSCRQMGCGTYFSDGKIYGTQAFQWFSDVKEDPNGGVDKLPGDNSTGGGGAPDPVVIDNNSDDNSDDSDKPDNIKKPNDDFGGGTTFGKNDSKKNKGDNSQIFSFKLGGYLNYSMGNIEELSTSFDSRLLSGHGTAMLGVRFGNRRKKSCFGVFGTYGRYSSEATALLSDAAGDESQLSFFEIEGGFILNEWLRISGGKGFDKLSGEGDNEERDYITGTLGFSFGPKNFKIEVNNTMMFPQDENQILWRPSVGLAVKLDFLRK